MLGLPRAEEAATEEAIFKVFSRYGEILRIIFQEDGGAHASAGHATAAQSQRAVVVYRLNEAATAALASDGEDVLGRRVHVILATNLPG